MTTVIPRQVLIALVLLLAVVVAAIAVHYGIPLFHVTPDHIVAGGSGNGGNIMFHG